MKFALLSKPGACISCGAWQEASDSPCRCGGTIVQARYLNPARPPKGKGHKWVLELVRHLQSELLD